jgi:hypothetical protein
LLAGIRGVDLLIAAGSPLPPFDVQAPLLSLPGIFRTRLDTIPSNELNRSALSYLFSASLSWLRRALFVPAI